MDWVFTFVCLGAAMEEVTLASQAGARSYCPIREGEPPGEPARGRGSAGTSPSHEPDTISDIVYQGR